jgi:hypothetical protein
MASSEHPVKNPSETQLVEVAFAFIRMMSVQGNAVLLLCETNATAEAAYSNLRSLFELYVDFRYLLQGDEKEVKIQKAHQALLYAARDLTSSAAIEGFDQERTARMLRSQTAFGARYPDLYAEFEQAWSKSKSRPRHWSGLRRTDMIRQFGTDADGLRLMYKLLSWFAHGVLTPLLDVSRTNDGATTVLGPTQSPDRVAYFACGQAAGLLEDAWRGIEHHGWSRPGPGVPPAAEPSRS